MVPRVVQITCLRSSCDILGPAFPNLATAAANLPSNGTNRTPSPRHSSPSWNLAPREEEGTFQLTLE